MGSGGQRNGRHPTRVADRNAAVAHHNRCGCRRPLAPQRALFAAARSTILAILFLTYGITPAPYHLT